MLEFLAKPITLFSMPTSDGTSTFAIILPIYALILIALAIVLAIVAITIITIKIVRKKEKDARNVVVKTVTMDSDFSPAIQNTPAVAPPQKGRKGKAEKPAPPQASRSNDNYSIDFLKELGLDENDIIQNIDETTEKTEEVVVDTSKKNSEPVEQKQSVVDELSDLVIAKKEPTMPQTKTKRTYNVPSFASNNSANESEPHTSSEKTEPIKSTPVEKTIAVEGENNLATTSNGEIGIKEQSGNMDELAAFYAKPINIGTTERRDFYKATNSNAKAENSVSAESEFDFDISDTSTNATTKINQKDNTIAISSTAQSINHDSFDDLILSTSPKQTVPTKQTTPEVIIKQTAPEVAIKQTAPEVTTKQTAPEVTTKQTAPEVATKQTTPEVVIVAKPEISQATEQLLDFSTFCDAEETSKPIEQTTATIVTDIKNIDASSVSINNKPEAPKKPTTVKKTASDTATTNKPVAPKKPAAVKKTPSDTATTNKPVAPKKPATVKKTPSDTATTNKPVAPKKPATVKKVATATASTDKPVAPKKPATVKKVTPKD